MARLTDHGRALLSRMNRGEIITDIGQIDPATKRLLRRWLAKGYVYQGEDFTYPQTKKCYAGAGFYDVPDGEPMPAMPLNVKFYNL